MANSRTPRRIALWGYGAYGKRLFRAIRDNWSEQYRVTAVFDAACQVGQESDDLEAQGLQIDDPSHVESTYRSGLFDAVVISVAKKPFAVEISDTLNSLGIPVITLKSIDDFKGSSHFGSCALPGYDGDFLGYELHAYENVYAASSFLCRACPQLYLFDGTGAIIRDNWFKYSIDICPGIELNAPMSLSRVPDDPVILRGEYCIVNRSWSKNYWHFTFEQLDQIQLMQSAGFAGSYVLAKASFTMPLLEMMGIDESRVLWLDDLREGVAYQFEKVLVLSTKYHDNGVTAPVMVELSRVIEGAVERDKELTGRSYPTRLFVKRIGVRKLVELDELIASLGFETIDPDQLSVKEQIAYFHEARIVLCPHGANSTNSLYMRPGSVFIETFGGGWIRPCCHEPLFLKGVHYLPVIDMPVKTNTADGQLKDYSINSRLLTATIRSAAELAGL